MTALYEQIANPALLVRQVNVIANHVAREEDALAQAPPEQLDLFLDSAALSRERERRMQRAMLEIKRKFGKNAILKGMNLEDGATTIERNRQVGGHRA